MPFQQYRKVNVAGTTIQNADMEFSVETTTKGKTKFDLTIWNLTKSTFDSFQKDEPVTIEAGWEDGPQANILFGTVNSTKTELDDSDTKYIIKGQSEGYQLLNQGIDKTYGFNTPIPDVVRDLADRVGLEADAASTDVTVGFDTGEENEDGVSIFRTFVLDKDRPVKRELDELVDLAEEQTDKEWEWAVRGKTLSFKPKNEGTQTGIVLSYENSLTEISRVEDSAVDNAENSTRLEFEMMLEPRLTKGSIVAVESGDFNGPWKIESLKHQSSTTGGDHMTSGKLLPQNEEYTIQSGGS